MRDRMEGTDLEPWADFKAAGLVVPGRKSYTRGIAKMPEGGVVRVDVYPLHINGDTQTVLIPTVAAQVNRISPPRARRIQ